MRHLQAGSQGALRQVRFRAEAQQLAAEQLVLRSVRGLFHCSDYRDGLECSQNRSRCFALSQPEGGRAMEQLVLMVPTYYGATYGDPELFTDKEEFDEPHVPVLVRQAAGVRVVLGTNDFEDLEKPDIQIERRPNGWAIFLHPVGGGDPTGLVYFLDDGRSFLVPEGLVSEQIKVLGRDDRVPMIDDPPLARVRPNRFPSCPNLSAA